METIASVYLLKDYDTGKTYGPLERYLGDNIGKTILEYGENYWYMSSDDYMKESTKNINT